MAIAQGLSPLARGNLVRRPCAGALLGPIPARAGEPKTKETFRLTDRAYPRSRGGTFFIRLARLFVRGLSPLARGNPHRSRYPHAAVGPIPARAGEPAVVALGGLPVWAYPRSRGGTLSALLSLPFG